MNTLAIDMPDVAPPCADCETTEGYIPPRQKRPVRRTVERDGEQVSVCQACYDGHRAAALAERRIPRRLHRRGLGGHPRAIEDGLDPAAVPPRVAVVRAAKRQKQARGLDMNLTPEELDAVLPPVECRRTRLRLGRSAMESFAPGGSIGIRDAGSVA